MKNIFAIVTGSVALLLLASALFMPAGFRQAQFLYPGLTALAVALVIGLSDKVQPTGSLRPGGIPLFSGLALALLGLNTALLDLIIVAPLGDQVPLQSAIKGTIIAGEGTIFFLLLGWSVLVSEGFRRKKRNDLIAWLVFLTLLASLAWGGWNMVSIWPQLPRMVQITAF